MGTTNGEKCQMKIFFFSFTLTENERTSRTSLSLFLTSEIFTLRNLNLFWVFPLWVYGRAFYNTLNQPENPGMSEHDEGIFDFTDPRCTFRSHLNKVHVQRICSTGRHAAVKGYISGTLWLHVKTHSCGVIVKVPWKATHWPHSHGGDLHLTLPSCSLDGIDNDLAKKLLYLLLSDSFFKNNLQIIAVKTKPLYQILMTH